MFAGTPLKSSSWRTHLDLETVSVGNCSTPLNNIDLSLCKLINKVISKNENMIIVYPFSQCNAISLFALESYFALLDKYGANTNHARNHRVLIVTGRSEHEKIFSTIQKSRTEYQSFIRHGTVKMDKTIKRISPYISKKNKLYYPNNEDCNILFSRFPTFDIPDRTKIVIVDLDSISRPTILEDYLEAFKEISHSVDSILFTTTNWASKNISLIKKEFGALIWGYNPKLLGNEITQLMGLNIEQEVGWIFGPNIAVSIPYSNFMLEPEEKLEVVPVVDKQDQVVRQVFTSWKGYSTLSDYVERKGEDNIVRNVLIQYKKLLNDLQRLVLSPQLVTEEEEHRLFSKYSSLKERLNWLNYKMSDIDHLESIYFDIKKLYDLLIKEDAGKPQRFSRLLDEFIDANKKVVVCCFRDPDAVALQSKLAEKYSIDVDKLSDIGIDVAYLYKFYKIRKRFDYLILPGALPYSGLNIFLSPLFNKCIALLYPTEFKFTSKQLEKSKNILYEQGSTERIHTVHKLCGNKKKVSFEIGVLYSASTKRIKLFEETLKPNNESTLKRPKLRLFEKSKEKEIKDDIDHWSSLITTLKEDILIEDKELDLDDIIDEIYAKETRDGESIVPPSETKKEDLVLITFENGFQMEFPKKHMVNVLRKDKIVRKYSTQLVQGDYVLLIDRELGKTLLHPIFDELRLEPKVKTKTKLAEIWQIKLTKHAKENKHTEKDIHELMKVYGTKIMHPSTIRNWRDGVVIGPRNREDIKIIGEVYNDDFLIQYWEEIGEAVSYIRGLHIKVSKYIHKRIPIMAVKALYSDDDEIIDADIGLTMRGIASRIEILKVSSVKDVNVCDDIIETRA